MYTPSVDSLAFSAETESTERNLCVHPSNLTLSSIYLQVHGLIYLIMGFPENSWEFFVFLTRKWVGSLDSLEVFL